MRLEYHHTLRFLNRFLVQAVHLESENYKHEKPGVLTFEGKKLAQIKFDILSNGSKCEFVTSWHQFTITK